MDHSINLWNFEPRMALPNRKTSDVMILCRGMNRSFIHLMVTMI